eukprot:3623926-Pleurochrysis_carterae.AAC.1
MARCWLACCSRCSSLCARARRARVKTSALESERVRKGGMHDHANASFTRARGEQDTLPPRPTHSFAGYAGQGTSDTFTCAADCKCQACSASLASVLRKSGKRAPQVYQARSASLPSALRKSAKRAPQ